MTTVYVNRVLPSNWLIHPVPEDLANYLIVEVDEGIDLTDKKYDINTKRFVIDTELLALRAEREKQHRMSLVANVIAPLQDALDLDMATDEEKAALLTWKKYRVVLNRVDCSTAPDIDWPEQPE